MTCPGDHQSSHLSLVGGFIFDPAGQLNTSAKSGLFNRGPRTLHLINKINSYYQVEELLYSVVKLSQDVTELHET